MNLRGTPHAVAVALLLAVTVVWGWTFVLVKDAVSYYGVLSFLAVRFTIAALAMAAVGGFTASPVAWRTGSAIGLVLAASYALQTFGLRLTTATNAGLITGLFVVLAPLWNHLLFRVTTTPLLWGVLGLSVAGLALLTGARPDAIAHGDMLVLACAAGFGLHVALLDRHAKRHPAGDLAKAQLAACAAVFLALALAAERPAPPPASVWPALLVTGVAASAGAFYAQTWAQRHLNAVEAALVLAMEPVFAAIFGYALAGDRLTLLQAVGGATMLGAMVFAVLWRQTASPSR